MPASQSLSPISFHGDTIYVVNHQGEPFAPVKPIIENMGLDWRAQQRKGARSQVRWGMVMLTIPAQSGRLSLKRDHAQRTITIVDSPAGGAQKMLCIPVRKLAGFLATINPNKVKNELRGKIIRYQNECDDALWNYWTTGQAKRPASPGQPHQPDLFDDPHADRRVPDKKPRQISAGEKDLLDTIKTLDTTNRSLIGSLEETRASYIRLLESHVELLEEKTGRLAAEITPKRQRRKPLPVTDETASAIRELAATGMSKNEIARRLGRSTATVWWILRAPEVKNEAGR